MENHDELINRGIKYAKKNYRPKIGMIVAHKNHPITGILNDIKDGIGEVLVPAVDGEPEHSYFEPYEEIFNPSVVLNAARCYKAGLDPDHTEMVSL